MKRLNLASNLALLCSASCLNYSCINQIGNDDPSSSTIPITFSMQITSPSTRITGSSFDEGDKVGLFAILTSNSIKQKRYIDNIWLEYGKENIFIPERAIFYPEGDAHLDFISYYPYRPQGIEEKTSKLPVSVQADQSSAKHYSQSDFLIATVSDIESSDQAIELDYVHKFAKIKIVLKPKDSANAIEILKANPKITATGFKTQALYDVENNSFSNLSEEADITPYGNWSINKEGYLTGKEFIIIPQATDTDNQSFTMDWNGRIYTCPMPEISMTGSNQCEISITALEKDSPTLAGIVSSITGWSTANGGITENNNNINAIHLSSFSFDSSDIYKIYHNGRAIAQICREYLKSNKLTSTAITSYPIDENEEADLSQGTVLQLLDKEDEAINGGNISWDAETNTFSYTQGSSKAIRLFYIDSNGKILTDKPDNPLNVNITSYIVRDIRSGVVQTYPIVKIGTQYWMKENLHTTMYQDGTSISKQTELGTGAGYFKSEANDYYFYNGEAILGGKIAPEKWEIPKMKDWERLKNYLSNNASLIKAGKWIALSTGDQVPTTNNLTDFNALPVGIWYGDSYEQENKVVGYWTMDETGENIAENTIFFTGNSNEFVKSGSISTNHNYYKALSVRCIKE